MLRLCDTVFRVKALSTKPEIYIAMTRSEFENMCRLFPNTVCFALEHSESDLYCVLYGVVMYIRIVEQRRSDGEGM